MKETEFAACSSWLKTLSKVRLDYRAVTGLSEDEVKLMLANSLDGYPALEVIEEESARRVSALHEQYDMPPLVEPGRPALASVSFPALRADAPGCIPP